METKYKLIVCTVSLLVAFALGRYTVPVEVKIEKQIVTVEVEKKVNDLKTNERRVETEEVRLDGTKVRKIVTNTSTDSHQTSSNEERAATIEKETRDSRARLTASLLGGLSVSDLTQPPVFGLHVSKPILGPITFGVWGLTSKVGGISVGLQF